MFNPAAVLNGLLQDDLAPFHFFPGDLHVRSPNSIAPPDTPLVSGGFQGPRYAWFKVVWRALHADDARGDVELLRYVVHLGSAASLLEFVRQLISPGRVGMLARVVVLRALARWGEEQLEGAAASAAGA